MFPLSGMTARRFAADRVALAGEAAHLFPPIGAQGLNLGYRDVTALADVLAGRPDDPGGGPLCSPPTIVPGAATSSAAPPRSMR